MSEKCPLHDGLLEELKENNRKLDILLEKLQGDGGVTNRLIMLETKVASQTTLIGACGLIIVGRIIYDIVVGA